MGGGTGVAYSRRGVVVLAVFGLVGRAILSWVNQDHMSPIPPELLKRENRCAKYLDDLLPPVEEIPANPSTRANSMTLVEKVDIKKLRHYMGACLEDEPSTSAYLAKYVEEAQGCDDREVTYSAAVLGSKSEVELRYTD